MSNIIRAFLPIIVLLLIGSFSILHAQNVGVGTDNPQEFFSVGASSQFRVNANGNVVRINNVQYSFPAVQATSGSILANDGSGNLTWSKVTTGNISAIGTASNTTFLRGDGAWAAPAGGGGAVANMKHTTTAGTNGGAYSSPGSWVTRILNTVTDPSGIVSLASNQFTLQAGTYQVTAFQMISSSNIQCKIRLRNITDGTTTIVGNSFWATSANPYLSGVFTISSAKTFEIQFRGDTNDSGADYFFGAQSNTGEPEVYLSVDILKM